MTNEEYVFQQTSKERKHLGRGAFYKKNGSKSKKCTLPSDYLSAKQRKELNGAMITYNLEKPMTWTEFKFLPVAVQCEYILNLHNKYEARGSDIEQMFEINSGVLDSHMRRMGYKDKVMFGRGGKLSASQKWLDFLAEHAPLVEESEPVEEPTPEMPVKVVAPANIYIATSGTLHYKGDPAVIFAKALNALDPSQRYYITINFEHQVENEDLTDF